MEVAIDGAVDKPTQLKDLFSSQAGAALKVARYR